MKNKVYIIRFKDNTIMPLRIKPLKDDLQEGAMVYEVNDNADLSMLSAWYGHNFDLINFKKIII